MKTAETLGGESLANDPKVDAGTLIGKQASLIEPQPVAWLWPGRIARGTLTIVDGDPGCGKSSLACDLAARVSTGRLWPDGESCVLGTAIVLSAEDDPASTLRPRLEAAGADLNRVIVSSAIFGTGDELRLLTLPDDLLLIEESVAQRGATLVVLDPLNAFLSGKVDSHRDQDIRRVLAHLTMMAVRTGGALVLIRHLNKSGSSNPIYRGGGSIGITAAARAAFLVGIDHRDIGPEKRRIFAPIKNNLAKMPAPLAFRLVQNEGDSVPHVEWIDGDADISARELLREPDAEGSSSVDKATEFLSEFLADGPRSTKEAEKAARSQGISSRTLDRARKLLKVKSFKGKGTFSSDWFIALPSEAHPCDGSSPSAADPAKSANEIELHQEGKVWRRSGEPLGENKSSEVRQTVEEAEIDRLARADGYLDHGRSEES
jgi:hypothetical protein